MRLYLSVDTDIEDLEIDYIEVRLVWEQWLDFSQADQENIRMWKERMLDKIFALYFDK